MSEEHLLQGIDALQDDEVRAKVSAGDLSAAGELDLDDEEQQLLLAVASDYPEVVGFGMNLSLDLIRSNFSVEKVERFKSDGTTAPPR